MSRNRFLPWHITIFAVSAAVCIVCFILYATRPDNWAAGTAAPSFRPSVTNGYILRDQLPESVYRYTLARISDYLLTNNLPTSSMSIENSTILFDPATYDFNLVLSPDDQTLHINLNVDNTAGVISTRVSMNGNIQQPLIPGTAGTAGGIFYAGFDALVNSGVSAIQANELGQAFATFSPAASHIDISADNIQPELPPREQGGLNATYNFSVAIDNKAYMARLVTIGIYDSRLYLTDTSTNKQVFDSGVLNQGS